MKKSEWEEWKPDANYTVVNIAQKVFKKSPQYWPWDDVWTLVSEVLKEEEKRSIFKREYWGTLRVSHLWTRTPLCPRPPRVASDGRGTTGSG